MGVRKQRGAAASSSTKKNQNAPLSAEERLQQEVLRHYAKTLYFNDLWKGFLTNISGLVLLMSVVVLQRMYHSSQGIGFIAGFEALSLVITTATIMFVRRWLKPLLSFKIAFAFALVQCVWFAHSYYRRTTKQPREIGDLNPDQLAFGSMYFLFCWISDRYMLRSQDEAKKNAQDVQAVLSKQQ
ncbi:hypothetical protein P43SY_005568 [Pythium insidiosum]|uniref:Transmembrane protein n=1 Tax=Pythium insidiosum TaxID=114742 RepID=A0AAD5M4X6_PYTIN|nr:hypothetical protein P43SY_005568 [Pythium insidiosum]